MGSYDTTNGYAVCGDFNDGNARVRHNEASLRNETGAQNQMADCDGSLSNAVLDIAFSRPFGTPDTTCSFQFLNATPVRPRRQVEQ